MEKFIDSCINDEFEGWNGDTVYELANGSKWELTSYAYSYSYSYRPKATIWRKDGRFFLQVATMQDMKEVRRVY